MENNPKKTVAIVVVVLVALGVAWSFMSGDSTQKKEAMEGASKKKEAPKNDTAMKSSPSEEKKESTTMDNDKDEASESDAAKDMTGTQEKTANSKQNTTEKVASIRKVEVKTSYDSPAGDDPVGFTITVDKDGVVTDASVAVLTKNEISMKWQQNVGKLLPAAIKGKKLSEISSIDKIGGSSLTTKSFNESLPKLKAQL